MKPITTSIVPKISRIRFIGKDTQMKTDLIINNRNTWDINGPNDILSFGRDQIISQSNNTATNNMIQRSVSKIEISPVRETKRKKKTRG